MTRKAQAPSRIAPVNNQPAPVMPPAQANNGTGDISQAALNLFMCLCIFIEASFRSDHAIITFLKDKALVTLEFVMTPFVDVATVTTSELPKFVALLPNVVTLTQNLGRFILEDIFGTLIARAIDTFSFVKTVLVLLFGDYVDNLLDFFSDFTQTIAFKYPLFAGLAVFLVVFGLHSLGFFSRIWQVVSKFVTFAMPVVAFVQASISKVVTFVWNVCIELDNLVRTSLTSIMETFRQGVSLLFKVITGTFGTAKALTEDTIQLVIFDFGLTLPRFGMLMMIMIKMFPVTRLPASWVEFGNDLSTLVLEHVIICIVFGACMVAGVYNMCKAGKNLPVIGGVAVFLNGDVKVSSVSFVMLLLSLQVSLWSTKEDFGVILEALSASMPTLNLPSVNFAAAWVWYLVRVDTGLFFVLAVFIAYRLFRVTFSNDGQLKELLRATQWISIVIAVLVGVEVFRGRDGNGDGVKDGALGDLWLGAKELVRKSPYIIVGLILGSYRAYKDFRASPMFSVSYTIFAGLFIWHESVVGETLVAVNAIPAVALAWASDVWASVFGLIPTKLLLAVDPFANLGPFAVFALVMFLGRAMIGHRLWAAITMGLSLMWIGMKADNASTPCLNLAAIVLVAKTIREQWNGQAAHEHNE